MKLLVQIGLLIISLYFLINGYMTYGLWSEGGPSGGYLPSIIGGFMAVLCLYDLLKNRTEKIAIVLDKKRFLSMIGGLIMSAFLVNYLGFYLMAIIGLFLWMFVVEHFSIRKTLLCEGFVLGSIYLIFTLWLQVPFPNFLGI